MRNYLFLGLLTLVFAYTAFEFGGVTRSEWNRCLLGLGLLAIIFWLTGRTQQLAPALDGRLLRLMMLLPVYVTLQLVPLPFSWLNFLSPTRAELLNAVTKIDSGVTWASLSVAPSTTFEHLLRLLFYIVVFFMTRELTWRFPARPWLPAVPVITIGTAESALGVAQYLSRGSAATGTFVNRNHFAGFLEMCLPLAGMLTVRSLRHAVREREDSIRFALLTCLLIGCAALITMGLAYSLSRMGMIAALASAVVVISLSVIGQKRTNAIRVGLVIVILFVVVLGVLGRFAEHASASRQLHEATGNARIQFWKETSRLIAAYPVFGCGLGAYSSAFQKYRTSEPLYLVDYAHNDYWQLLAELGLIGFSIAFAAATILMVRTFRAARDITRPQVRLLGVACAGSLSAIAVHSVADFNLYIPANAMLAAWIAGIASALEYFPAQHLRAESRLPRFLENSVR